VPGVPFTRADEARLVTSSENSLDASARLTDVEVFENTKKWSTEKSGRVL